jgi:hypothetical protein
VQEEFGRSYVNKVRAKYPDVPGRADYCVYSFRRAHDELAPGKRAGLVGTNTIGGPQRSRTLKLMSDPLIVHSARR